MNWFSAGLQWVRSTLFCYFNGKTKSAEPSYPTTHVIDGVILQSEGQSVRATDSRPRCSVYLTLSYTSNEQKLAELILTHQKSLARQTNVTHKQ